MDRWLSAIGIAVIIVAALVSFPQGDIAREDSRPEEKKSLKPAAVKTKPGVSPMVALVLDDFGYQKGNLEELEELNVPVTLAVLPNAPYSGAVSSFAEKNRFEVILHMPMEPENAHENLEKATLTSGMDDAKVKHLISDAFRSVPSAKGLSNHMGSKATKDARLMRTVFDDLKKRNFYFLDSFTSSRSVCKKVSRESGIKFIKRDVFLDNELKEDYIRRQLEKTEKVALKNGGAVAIGHDRKLTIDVLRKTVPEMQKRGIKFVTLSEIIVSDYVRD